MSQLSLKAHFGFITEPFSKEIATKALFLSEQLKALFERLQHFITRRGIALITGEVGSGKSTALRAFTDTVDKNHQALVYIDDPTLGLRGMFNSIARQLNLNAKFFKWQLVPELKAAIEKNFADYHKTTLLIIDDAQHLKPQALDELRLLTNPGLPGALAGQAFTSIPKRRSAWFCWRSRNFASWSNCKRWKPFGSG